MPYSQMAVCRARGTIFPTEGPGTSARMTCMERSLAKGSTAMIKTSTPMPPIQWVKLRQNSSPRGSASTSVRMLAPVVVKPDTVSNTASI